MTLQIQQEFEEDPLCKCPHCICKAFGQHIPFIFVKHLGRGFPFASRSTAPENKEIMFISLND